LQDSARRRARSDLFYVRDSNNYPRAEFSGKFFLMLHCDVRGHKTSQSERFCVQPLQANRFPVPGQPVGERVKLPQ
jgi:hypothetical protein